MEIRRKILTGYATLVLVLCIVILVLGVLWLNPAILSPPTSVPVEKPKTTQSLKAIQLTSGSWNDQAPVWSPDGKKIAFESDRAGNWSIWIMNANGSKPVQLTSDESVSRWPTWNPDSRKIAFLATRSGQSDIWIIDVDGTSLTRLTNDPMPKGPPQWSPDGKSLLFSKKQVSWNVWMSSIDGYDQIQLTKSSEDNTDPSWSSDGKRIVFASSRAGSYDIWSMNVDGSNQTQLTNEPADEVNPKMSPNGESILFMVHETGYWSLCIMKVIGEQYRQRMAVYLTEDSNPSWSPDGERILYWRYMVPLESVEPATLLSEVEVREDAEVFIMKTDGDTVRPTADSKANDMYSSWSPDGKKIAFTSNRNGKYNIWITPVEKLP